MSPLVRFAPSPTGYLHVGNARTALVNYLLVGARPESFILRFDDTDRERSKEEYVQGIRRDLRWLGLSWGEEFYQSQRLDLYQAAMERLIDAGRLYPCYETAEELEYARRRLRAKGLPPIYDRGSLRLTAAERAAYEAEGRRPHWRFRLEAGTVTWDDLVRGPCHYDTAHLSDPVLVRADGTFLYTLTSVVDDVDMAITHVVRGEDHVTNTAVQSQIFRALGAEPTLFAHLPLIIGADGEGLSKRLGSLSLDDLRLQGIEPMAVASLLGRLGTSDAIEAVSSLETLAEGYDLGHFGRGTPRFDPADLTRLNQKIIHAMPWEEAAARLRALGCDHAGEPFWQAVRGNLSTVAEAVTWWTVVHGPLPPVTVPADAAPVLAAAAALLPAEPWDGQTWKAWTGAVKDATGAKGKALFLPLRLALTGHDHGPEMSALLPLIGRAQAVARLAAVTCME